MLSGCGGYLTNWGTDLSKGVTNELVSDAGAAELSALTKDLVSSARNEALGPETNQQIQTLLTNAGKTTDAETEKLLVVFREQLRLSVREAIDEALNEQTLQEVGAVREQVAGAPLRADLELAISGMKPQLDQVVQSTIDTSIMSLQKAKDQEAIAVHADLVKWKPIAIAFVIGSIFLLIGLILGIILFIYHEKSHQKVIESLTR